MKAAAHAAEKGVDAAEFAARVERFAKLLSRLPSFLKP